MDCDTIWAIDGGSLSKSVDSSIWSLNLEGVCPAGKDKYTTTSSTFGNVCCCVSNLPKLKNLDCKTIWAIDAGTVSSNIDYSVWTLDSGVCSAGMNMYITTSVFFKKQVYCCM